MQLSSMCLHESMLRTKSGIMIEVFASIPGMMIITKVCRKGEDVSVIHRKMLTQTLGSEIDFFREAGMKMAVKKKRRRSGNERRTRWTRECEKESGGEEKVLMITMTMVRNEARQEGELEILQVFWSLQEYPSWFERMKERGIWAEFCLPLWDPLRAGMRKPKIKSKEAPSWTSEWADGEWGEWRWKGGAEKEGRRKDGERDEHFSGVRVRNTSYQFSKRFLERFAHSIFLLASSLQFSSFSYWSKNDQEKPRTKARKKEEEERFSLSLSSSLLQKLQRIISLL